MPSQPSPPRVEDPNRDADKSWIREDLAVHEQQLVIFDCDGILVDSEGISNTVLARMLSEQGLPTTLSESRQAYQGLLLSEVVTRAQEKLGRELPKDWLALFERERAEAFRNELRPIAGAARAVEQVLAAGFAVCVASQGKLEKTRLSLELTGLSGLFAEHALFSAEQVPRGKPAPDLFLHAASVMQRRPAECLVVEDTPSGVAAAVAANMHVLGYAADSDERSLRQAGAKIIRSLEGLVGSLEAELSPRQSDR